MGGRAGLPKLMKGRTTIVFWRDWFEDLDSLEAFGEHREDAGGALLFLGSLDGGGTLGRQQGDGFAGQADGIKVERHHDGLEGFAHLARGGETGRGLFFQTAKDDGLKLYRERGVELTGVLWLRELDGTDGLKLWRIGPVEGGDGRWKAHRG